MISKWASNFSTETWGRIKASRTNDRIKTYEVTITQDMVYSLYKSHIDHVTILEATDENSNGNDLEVYIKNQTTGKLKRFAVQSKIVYADNKYKTIDHYVEKNNSFQLFNLLSYSRYNDFIPIYFLYSFYDDYDDVVCDKGFYYNEYGIMICSAHEILINYFDIATNCFKNIPSVKDIFDDNEPFSFNEFLTRSTVQNKLRHKVFEPVALSPSIQNTIGFLIINNYECEYNSLINDDKWNKIKSSNFQNIIENSETDNFNPKYRIIVY